MLVSGILSRLSSFLLLGLVTLPKSSYTSSSNGQSEQNLKELKHFELEPPFIGAGFRLLDWDYHGSTVIDVFNKIKLTPEFSSRSGSIWSKKPLLAPSFIIDIDFKIKGEGTVVYGDGMAFWLTGDKLPLGHVLGAMAPWDGLGILIDTYDNLSSGRILPNVYALLNDGTMNYEKDKEGQGLIIDQCEMDVRNKQWNTRARITYVKDRFLKLQFNHEGWDNWVDCFTIEKLKLPKAKYIGFTAETGDVADEHEIHRVITTAVLNPDLHFNLPTEHGTSLFPDSFFDTNISSPSTLAIFLSISLVIFVGWYGFKIVTKVDTKRF